MNELELAKEVERIYFEGFHYRDAFSIVEDIRKVKEGNKCDL